jgi:hypothetical protein
MATRRGRARRRRLWACSLLLIAAPALGTVARDARAAGTAPSASPARQPQPVREYTDAAGRLCRVYLRQIVIDGKAATAYATVCREPDGRWVLSR